MGPIQQYSTLVVLAAGVVLMGCGSDNAADSHTPPDENARPIEHCSSDADCSFNGICRDAACECIAPWMGAACQSLAMGAVDKSVYGYRQGFPYTTSWGGSVQFDEESNQYIMAVSEYVEECANWGWNSTVVLATSTSPEGPYQRRFRLFGVMSHEAMFARGPAGEWVVYFTASASEGGLPAAGDAEYRRDEVCTREDYESECECPGDPDKGSNDPTWMSYTMTPLERSSWSVPVMVFDPGEHFINLQPDGTRAESIDANFNGVIEADGSFVGLWRTWQCVEDLSPPWSERLSSAEDRCFSVPHAIRADDWRNPASYQRSITRQKQELEWLFPEEYRLGPPERLALGIEDPMVYRDNRDPPVYHAIFHEMFEPFDNVAHAYSEDGVQWTYTGPVFTTDPEFNMPVVRFTDGGRTGLACERPQLIVRDGVLSHLIVGGIPTGLRIDSGESVDDSAEEYGWPGGATLVIPLR